MEQTNRTILFEQINPDKADLLTIIGEIADRKSLNDDELVEIHRQLEVSSFDEFIKKFEPTVHMVLDTNKSNVIFSGHHLGSDEELISIDSKDSLFQMLIYIMEARKGKKYVLTGFSDMLENMIPKEDAEVFLEERNQFIRYYAKYKGKVSAIKEKKLQDTMMRFDDGIFLLQTFLQSIHNMIASQRETKTADKAILHSEDMQVHIIKYADKYRYTSSDCINVDDREYENFVSEEINTLSVHKQLQHAQILQDCYMLPLWFARKEYGTIQLKYQRYCNLYVEVIKKFWREAKPLIETMLGVKEFFSLYGNTDGMKPKLIIGNFRIEDILQQKNREKLEAYLNSVNAKNFHRDTIWYAIVPNMANRNRDRREEVRERFKSQRQSYDYLRNKAEEISVLLELLGQYHIQSFLSLENAQENTFSTFVQKGIEAINEELDVLEYVEGKDYIIPCFPNFVVIPQEQACISIGKKVVYDELEERLYSAGDNNVWLDMVGIEASYVAAGLVAACQCPQFLKKYFRRTVNEELPGVAYRFSQEGHNELTTSEMLSETIEFPKEIIEDALLKSKGILFGQYQGKMIILTDRVFSFNRSNQLLVSMVQTINYIERVIRYETQDYKKNLIIQFFQRRPGSIISKWYGTETNCVNNILKENEELEYRIEADDKQCVFEFHFDEVGLVHNEIVSIFSD